MRHKLVQATAETCSFSLDYERYLLANRYLTSLTHTRFYSSIEQGREQERRRQAGEEGLIASRMNQSQLRAQ